MSTVGPVGGYSYVDAAAVVPPHPVAEQAMLAAAADGWADPGKLYAPARRARHLLDAARASVAEALGVRPDEVGFQPNGTLAAHAAVAGARAARSPGGPSTVVHSAIEHSAVLHAAGTGRTVRIGVDGAGRVDLDAFADAVHGSDVVLAALISASHEVGTGQPVAAVGRACTAAGIPLYVDAAASLGYAPLPAGWSVLTASARKWGGPAGVGILVVRKGTRWAAPWPGAEPGTLDAPGGLNLPAVVGAAASLRAVLAERDEQARRLRALVDLVRARVAGSVPDVEVVGDPADRLPHLVTFSCLYVDGEALLHELDRAGFGVSSGSSCTASTLRPSHVLEAMGVLSHGNVRLSLHRGTTEDDVHRFLDVLPDAVARLRTEAGVDQ
jgi:cysteine desulfurase